VAIQVRDGTLDDVEAIVSVTAEGWRRGYHGIVAHEHLATLPVERWRHEVSVGLRRPVDDAFTLVAEIDGRFAGYCYVAAPARDGDLGPDVAELAAIYVDPDRWRQGAGDALMRTVVGRLAGLGYAEAVLWTFKENQAAIAFYVRNGWSSDGAERVHPRAQALAVRYRLPIG
jgi:GNAT superfamily N-acetyltransferase